MADVNVEDGDVSNIQDTVEILLKCRENGRKISSQLPPSIYMVPRRLRDLNPSSFEPQVVSIGPLHREDKTLQEFEEQKATYLHHLLDRLDHLPLSPKQILDACLHKVNNSIHKIRECYGGVMTYTDAELAQMMVIDAFFILEFLFPSIEHQHLISGNVILKHSIFHDLVLLENQIPFFVLQDIFDCTISHLQTSSLTSGILLSFKFLNPFRIIGDDHGVGISHHHIIGLLQKSFHPKNNIRSSPDRSLPLPNHSAVELDKTGVKFKPNKDENWQMAIEFWSSWIACFCWCWGNRILRMPVLYIEENTELFLRNVIAYEQCTPGVPNYVTSYACVIDFLVDTKEDLFILVESKVLINTLASKEDATNMINNVCKEVILSEFYYQEQWQQLDRYYNGYWPRNLARFKRAYFRRPWNMIALFAGLVLFALTIVQTIFTIKDANKINK